MMNSQSLINELGGIAIQIQQAKKNLSVLETKYDTLNAQAALLQQLEQQAQQQKAQNEKPEPATTDQCADHEHTEQQEPVK